MVIPSISGSFQVISKSFSKGVVLGVLWGDGFMFCSS